MSNDMPPPVTTDAFEARTRELLEATATLVSAVEHNADLAKASHREMTFADFKGTAEAVRKVAEDLKVHSESYRRKSIDIQALKDEQHRIVAGQIGEIRDREEACKLMGEDIIKLTMTVTNLKKQLADTQKYLELTRADHRDHEVMLTEARTNLSDTRLQHESLKASISQLEKQQASERAGLDDRAEGLRKQQQGLEATASQQTEEAEHICRLKLEHDSRQVDLSKAEDELAGREERNHLAQRELSQALGSLQSLTLLLGPHNETRISCTDAKQIATAVKDKFASVQRQLKFLDEINKSLHISIDENTEATESIQVEMANLQSERDELKQSLSTAASEVALLKGEIRGLRHSNKDISKERTKLAAANEKLKEQITSHVSHLEREHLARQDLQTRLEQTASTLATSQSQAASIRQKDQEEIARLQKLASDRGESHVREIAERTAQATRDKEEVNRLQNKLRAMQLEICTLKKAKTAEEWGQELQLKTKELEQAKAASKKAFDGFQTQVDSLMIAVFGSERNARVGPPNLQADIHVLSAEIGSSVANVYRSFFPDDRSQIHIIPALDRCVGQAQSMLQEVSTTKELQKKLHDSDAERNGFKVECVGLRKQLDVAAKGERESIKVERANLHKQLDDAIRERDATKAKLEGANRTIKSHESRRHDLQEQHLALHEQLATLTMERDNRNQAIECSNATAKANADENARLKKQLQDFESRRLEDTNRTTKSQEARYNDLQKQYFILQEQLATRTMERDALRLQDIGRPDLEARLNSLERSVVNRDTPASTRRRFDSLGSFETHDPTEENPGRGPKRKRGPTLANDSIRRQSSLLSDSVPPTVFRQPGSTRKTATKTSIPASNRHEEQWTAAEDFRRDDFTYGSIPRAIFDQVRQQINGHAGERGWDEIWPKWVQGTANGDVKCADRFAHRHRSDMSDGYACEDCFLKGSVCVAVRKGSLQIRSLRPQDRGDSTREDMGFWVANQGTVPE
ncbi:MAG: hypothetical protein L6R35_000866 [Caloplaca aegaea]|nr:MAG: hypothetical protein L6R35_000866 [Caloplaca aegaea]